MISVCLIGLDNSGKSCLIAPHVGPVLLYKASPPLGRSEAETSMTLWEPWGLAIFGPVMPLIAAPRVHLALLMRFCE